MDAFRTEAESAFRRRAAAYLDRRPGPAGSAAAEAPSKIWADLDAGAAPADLDRRVAVLDEASRREPRLGFELLGVLASRAGFGPVEETACRLGRLAGAATHVLEAGAAAARDRGAFASSLMGCRQTQESLAGLVALADGARLGACRLCRLIERGDGERAGREAVLLRARLAPLADELRTAARSLLGEDWVAVNIPPDGFPPGPERTLP